MIKPSDVEVDIRTDKNIFALEKGEIISFDLYWDLIAKKRIDDGDDKCYQQPYIIIIPPEEWGFKGSKTSVLHTVTHKLPDGLVNVLSDTVPEYNWDDLSGQRFARGVIKPKTFNQGFTNITFYNRGNRITQPFKIIFAYYESEADKGWAKVMEYPKAGF